MLGITSHDARVIRRAAHTMQTQGDIEITTRYNARWYRPTQHVRRA